MCHGDACCEKWRFNEPDERRHSRLFHHINLAKAAAKMFSDAEGESLSCCLLLKDKESINEPIKRLFVFKKRTTVPLSASGMCPKHRLAISKIIHKYALFLSRQLYLLYNITVNYAIAQSCSLCNRVVSYSKCDWTQFPTVSRDNSVSCNQCFRQRMRGVAVQRTKVSDVFKTWEGDGIFPNHSWQKTNMQTKA